MSNGAAAGQAGGTLTAEAARFGVSVSFVTKAVAPARAWDTGGFTPPRGSASLLTKAAQHLLLDCLRQQPDANLDELRAWLAAVGGPAFSKPKTRLRQLQARSREALEDGIPPIMNPALKPNRMPNLCWSVYLSPLF